MVREVCVPILDGKCGDLGSGESLASELADFGSISGQLHHPPAGCMTVKVLSANWRRELEVEDMTWVVPGSGKRSTTTSKLMTIRGGPWMKGSAALDGLS